MSIKLAFLSSPILGLESCREAAKRAINGLDGWKCVCMEDFGADPLPSLQKCFDRLKDCHLYVGILGNRYGSLYEGSEKSYTELEYDEACRLGIRPLVFVAAGEFQTPIAERESDSLFEKLGSFKQRVATHRFQCQTGSG